MQHKIKTSTERIREAIANVKLSLERIYENCCQKGKADDAYLQQAIGVSHALDLLGGSEITAALETKRNEKADENGWFDLEIAREFFEINPRSGYEVLVWVEAGGFGSSKGIVAPGHIYVYTDTISAVPAGFHGFTVKKWQFMPGGPIEKIQNRS